MTKTLAAKIRTFISAAAVIVLSVSTAAPRPLFFCLITIAVLAALVFKGKDAIFTKPLRSLTSAHLVPAVLICACMGFNFYDAWFDSGIIARIASLIGLPGRFIALLLAVFGAMAAIPAAAILIADYSEIVIDGYRKSPTRLARESRGSPCENPSFSCPLYS